MTVSSVEPPNCELMYKIHAACFCLSQHVKAASWKVFAYDWVDHKLPTFLDERVEGLRFCSV